MFLKKGRNGNSRQKEYRKKSTYENYYVTGGIYFKRAGN